MALLSNLISGQYVGLTGATGAIGNYELPLTLATLDIQSDVPAFRATLGSVQTVASSGVETKVQINTEDFDTNNNFDPTTNYRFTPTVAGYYQTNFSITTRAVSTHSGGYCVLYKNGTSFETGGNLNGTFTANTNVSVTGSTIVYLNGTTDYIELYGVVSGTGTLTFEAARFSSCLIRSA